MCVVEIRRGFVVLSLYSTLQIITEDSIPTSLQERYAWHSHSFQTQILHRLNRLSPRLSVCLSHPRWDTAGTDIKVPLR